MSNKADWERVNEEATRERRKEPRVALRFHIEVSGFDSEGKFFSEQTTTDDISEHGCRFQLKREVGRNSVVAVRLLRPQGMEEASERLVLFQVARAEKEAARQTLGALKVQSDQMWPVSFPEPRQSHDIVN